MRTYSAPIACASAMTPSRSFSRSDWLTPRDGTVSPAASVSGASCAEVYP